MDDRPAHLAHRWPRVNVPAPLTAVSVVAYQVACTLFWPTPSEAPLLLYPQWPLVTILALCVVGKVLGAIAILTGWKQVERLASRVPRRFAGVREWVRER